MASLTERLKKNSNLKDVDDIVRRDPAPTGAIPLNIALQGRCDGGISPGITMFAGPSRHFKSNLALISVAAWMDKYPESSLLFYDSEHGAKDSYFDSVGIDKSRVVHKLIHNVEELKFDMNKQIKLLDPKGADNVIIMIDSIGNLASKREVENADNENSAADMVRAKEFKSMWRVLTPYFESLGIPVIVINHTYETMEMFSKTVVSGGQGNILAANDIIVVGRQVDKDKKTKELMGHNFILNIHKSRTVREGRKIPLNASFEEGIQSYNSLLDIAIEAELAVATGGPWYAWVDPDTGEIGETKFMRKDALQEDFWTEKMAEPGFKSRLEKYYRLDSYNLLKKAERGMLEDAEAEY